MNEAALFAVTIAASYLLGGVPWGLLIGRWSSGVDVRQTGSGNIGSSNVLRTAGARPAVIALLLDVAKGVVPVYAARLAADAAGLTGAEHAGLQVAAALSALAGHSWPVYLGFRGGKGVATGLGGLFALSPWVCVPSLLLALVVMRLTRFISLGSMVGATAGAVALAALWLVGELPWPYAVHALAAWCIIVGRHGSNIRRLLAGAEARLGDPPPTRAQPEG